MTAGYFIVGGLAFLLGVVVGTFMGWNRCDTYWHDRLTNRPESVHLGPYPEPWLKIADYHKNKPPVTWIEGEHKL